MVLTPEFISILPVAFKYKLLGPNLRASDAATSGEGLSMCISNKNPDAAVAKNQDRTFRIIDIEYVKLDFTLKEVFFL